MNSADAEILVLLRVSDQADDTLRNPEFVAPKSTGLREFEYRRATKSGRGEFESFPPVQVKWPIELAPGSAAANIKGRDREIAERLHAVQAGFR